MVTIPNYLQYSGITNIVLTMNIKNICNVPIIRLLYT